MYEFSVEQAANNIYDHRTREYFREVLNNYFNSNYRSSTVMLWTVVICDLIYKLQYLKDIHQDTSAENFLKEMSDFQQSNPANPKWEETLLKEVFNRTSLLEAHELDALQNLHKHRHLSAHPVINKTHILFQPHREMVISDIRIALETVLTKPPILTKQVFHELVADLENVKDIFPKGSQLKTYLESKYLKNLNEDISCQIFKSLWRITFKTIEEKCNSNREINFRALKVLFERNRDILGKFVSNNTNYFSELSDGAPLRYAIFFLGDYPHLFALLTDAAKELISAKAVQDIDLHTVSYFLSKDIEEHILAIVNKINNEHKHDFGGKNNINPAHVLDLAHHASSAGIKENINLLLITMYINAVDFDAADSLFEKFISPYIDNFSIRDLTVIIKGISQNNQTYWRSKADSDHVKIVEKAKVMIEGFDISQHKTLPQK